MTFYITTPIFYVNDTPHIGHAYCTIIADVLHRYHKLFGDDSIFLTGTDEHGQKVEKAAKNRGLTPEEHVDDMVVKFQDIWKELNISNDFFMRTTYPFHKEMVQEYLKYLYNSGDIYLKEYEGWYCVSEEIFYTEKELIDGLTPTGKRVEKISEKNYFFRMSRYQTKLIEHIQNNRQFIRPEGKMGEILSFLKQPLDDLCISRPKTRLSWGIELPFDKDFVTYVWFDALLNYVTALKGGEFNDDPNKDRFTRYWNSVTHLIGKDILLTHAVYWPTMLMALGMELPQTIFAHGWWLNTSNEKMSKSEGPVISPLDVKDIIGVDQLRYFLTRDINLGNDAQFSLEGVYARINSELSNNLGNMLSRAAMLISKHFFGKIPPLTTLVAESRELKEQIDNLQERVKGHIYNLEPSLAIGKIIDTLTLINRYIDTLAPWNGVKGTKDEILVAGECLSLVIYGLRVASKLLAPVMPNKMAVMLDFLNSDTITIVKEPLFPRMGN